MERKCYIIVVTQALVVYLICPPSALGPAALVLRVYISGRPLVPVLQLLLITPASGPCPSLCIHVLNIDNNAYPIYILANKILLTLKCRYLV